VSEAIEVFRTLGVDIVDVRFPDVTQAIAIGLQLRSGGGSCARATYPSRKDEYGPVLASVIEAGRALSGLDYQKILLRRLDFARPCRCAIQRDRPAAHPGASIRATDPRYDPDARRAA